MKYPKLKNTTLCYIILIVIMLLEGLIACVILKLKFLPQDIIIILFIAYDIGYIIHILKSFNLFLTVSEILVEYDLNNKARKYFFLPRSFSIGKVEKRISTFGKSCEPTAKFPVPEILRYKSSRPVTIFSKGIEKIIAIYHTEYLGKDEYKAIVSSAKANSKMLKGKKKHLFLDKEQKKSPINQVTVIIIVAENVEEELQSNLFNTVCKNGGDGYDISVLPCVIDLENQSCTFDSRCITFMMQYPVKNRGINFIKKYIFGGKFPYDNSPEKLEPIKIIDPEQSLWDFLHEIKLIKKKNEKRFKKMKSGDVIFKDGFVYAKWKEQGVWLSAKLSEKRKTIEIDAVDFWNYPKIGKISDNTISVLKKMIDTNFTKLGYKTKFIQPDDKTDKAIKRLEKQKARNFMQIMIKPN